jgi:hypothetical protein
MEYLKDPKIIGGAVFVIIVVVLVFMFLSKSSFSPTLLTPMEQLNNLQPNSFPPLNQPDSGGINLEKPDVPEEIGFAMIYPQGTGVGMSKNDSNSFYPGNPNSLLTDYNIPEAYGEPSLIDSNSAANGSRIIKIKDTGNQMLFKPVDETTKSIYAGAYYLADVQKGDTLINGTENINYNSSPFDPEQNLKLQSSVGKESSLANCETRYPNVIKYNGMCITEGDIPYGQVVNNKVNPRLVSRWESYTGNYSRENALQSIDGLLYPTLNVNTN